MFLSTLFKRKKKPTLKAEGKPLNQKHQILMLLINTYPDGLMRKEIEQKTGIKNVKSRMFYLKKIVNIQVYEHGAYLDAQNKPRPMFYYKITDLDHALKVHGEFLKRHSEAK